MALEFLDVSVRKKVRKNLVGNLQDSVDKDQRLSQDQNGKLGSEATSSVSKSCEGVNVLLRQKASVSRPKSTLSDSGNVPRASLRPRSSNSNDKADASHQSISLEKSYQLRRELVQELLTTEVEYIHDLKAFQQVVRVTDADAKQANIDTPTLIGNLDQVIESAVCLEKSLQRTSFACDESLSIGPVFVAESDSLCQAYKVYCSNHTVLSEPLLTQYQQQSSKRQYLDVVLKELQQHKIQLLDMRSVLIKPVQRILKYPLFLDRLLAYTPTDHCDHSHLQQATLRMVAVATEVNTYTKRMEMVHKYGNASSDTSKPRFSFHSLVKKSSRVTAKLTASLGLSSLVGI